MKPLLAHTYEPKRVSWPCFVQPKLNGVRALYQNGRFQSRNEEPFPPGLLDHLSSPLQSIFQPSVILDGELYVHGWPLQRILGAVTPIRGEPNEDTLQVEYHVFDIVDFTAPFIQRLTRPVEEPKELTKVFLVPTCVVQDEAEANRFYAYWISQGYEGMMYRLGDCPYTVPKMENINAQGRKVPYKGRFLSDQDNRVWHLLKRKNWLDDEFECMGIEEGEGKYKGTTGALVCSSKAFDYVDKPFAGRHKIYKNFSVSSGLTDQQRDFYFQHPPIGKLIKVRYLVLSSDGIPLNPSILAIL